MTNAEDVFILVVDDEGAIRYSISKTLQRVGYQVDVAASGEEAVIKLWDVASIKNGMLSEPREFHGHQNIVSGLAFSPDGELLASSGPDGVARIFDVASGQQVLTLHGHEAAVWGVTFSADGSKLATAGHDMIARVYLLDVEELRDLARSRVTRPLTDSECQQYLHMERCPA